MFQPMGSDSEQLLARFYNAITKVANIDKSLHELRHTDHELDSIIAEVEIYLVENDKFVNRLTASGDMS